MPSSDSNPVTATASERAEAPSPMKGEEGKDKKKLEILRAGLQSVHLEDSVEHTGKIL